MATSILKAMLISGWDGNSHYDTTFMQVLGRYINLKAFRSHGKFQPHSKLGAGPAQNPNGKTHSRDPPLDPHCGPTDGVRIGASVDNSRRPQGNCNRPELGLNMQALGELSSVMSYVPELLIQLNAHSAPHNSGSIFEYSQ